MLPKEPRPRASRPQTLASLSWPEGLSEALPVAGGGTLGTGTAKVAPPMKGKPTAVSSLGLGGTSVSPSPLLALLLGLNSLPYTRREVGCPYATAPHLPLPSEPSHSQVPRGQSSQHRASGLGFQGHQAPTPTPRRSPAPPEKQPFLVKCQAGPSRKHRSPVPSSLFLLRNSSIGGCVVEEPQHPPPLLLLTHPQGARDPHPPPALQTASSGTQPAAPWGPLEGYFGASWGLRPVATVVDS